MRTALFTSSALAGLSGPAALAWAEGDEPALDEVVITAQKRTEKLQDVPVSAAVVSTGTLANSNAGDVSDLNKMVPSLNINGSINGRVPMGMRGISSVSNEGTVGLSSGVALIVDGVPIPSDSVAANQLEDIERVEVLKGPQATLGGRTAAAGEVNMVTNSPSRVWTGNTALTFTNDAEYRLNAFLAGPLTDKLAFSLSGWGNTRDYPMVNAYDGKHTSQRVSGGRFKLLFQPNDDLDVTLSLHLAQSRSFGDNFVYTYVTPGSHILGVPKPFLTTSALLPGITPSNDNLTYNSPVTQAGAQIFDHDETLNIDYRLGSYTLSSTTAFQHEGQKNVQDLFDVGSYFFTALTGGAAPFNNTQTQWEDIAQTSEEVKLVSPVDQPLSFIVGLFYSDSSVDEKEIRGWSAAPVNFHVTPDTKTADAYGRITWKALDHFNVVAGLRFNYDALNYSDYQVSNGTAGTPVYSSSASQDQTAAVGDISLQYKPSESLMGYFTYARGYSPGAYNTSITLTSNVPLTPVGQEHINHFELGTKGSYFGNRLNLNAALFDTVYDDFQIQSFTGQPGALALQRVLLSAGQAETRGLELDGKVAATNLLKITANAAYIRSVFNNYANAPCWYGQPPAQGCSASPNNTLGVQDLSGTAMPNAPKLKFVIAGEQQIPIDSVPIQLAVGGDYSYRTSAQMLADANPQTIQAAYGILNLHGSARSEDGSYSISLMVNNVLDKHYLVDMEDFWGAPWKANTVIAQPARDTGRYVGVRLAAGF